MQEARHQNTVQQLQHQQQLRGTSATYGRSHTPLMKVCTRPSSSCLLACLRNQEGMHLYVPPEQCCSCDALVPFAVVTYTYILVHTTRQLAVPDL